MSEITQKEAFPLVKKHTSYPQTNRTIGVKTPEELEKQREDKFNEDLENDSYFGLGGAVLIIDGWKALEPILKRDQKRVTDYNVALKEVGAGISIRCVNKVTPKDSPFVYMYNGKYLFEGNGRAKKYRGKFDARDWKTLLTEEQFKEVGVLPRMELPDLRFQRVKSLGKNTMNIIIPHTLFLSQRIREIFNNFSYYKVFNM